MSRQKKIPESEKQKVQELEKRILENSQIGNLQKAKRALNDLRPILEKYDQKARLLQGYLYLYEGALESYDLEVAKRGFQFVRDQANKKTRLYLEATSLLAITYLRGKDLFSAEPLMHEVLNNDNFIKSAKQRKIFIAELVDRFDREGAVTALSRVYQEPLPEKQVHERAMDLLRDGLSEEELEERLGRSVPDEVRDFILRVNRASMKSLPSADRLLLPLPKEIIRDRKVGSLIFRGIHQRLYKYICDDGSEVYQTWIRDGLDAICSKSYVAGVVVAVLTDMKIGAGAIAIGLTSLVIQKGLTNFCSAKPRSFFSVRGK